MCKESMMFRDSGCVGKVMLYDWVMKKPIIEVCRSGGGLARRVAEVLRVVIVLEIRTLVAKEGVKELDGACYER